MVRQVIAVLVVLSQSVCSAQQIKGGLKVFILQGQFATHNIPSGRVTLPVVEIRDQKDLPLPGVEVTFELPDSGPGGYFVSSDGKQQKAQTVRTTAYGQASPKEMIINREAGPFEIHVTARQGDSNGAAVIRQANSLTEFAEEPPPQEKKSRLWLMLLLAGGAAAGGGVAYAATRGDSTPAVAPIPTITARPGTISIGGPR